MQPDPEPPRLPGAPVLLARDAGGWLMVSFDAAHREIGREHWAEDSVAEAVARRELDSPLWVVRTLREAYPPLLAAGVRLRRAHDLLLCHAILRDTALLEDPLPASASWLRTEQADEQAQALFELDSGPETAGTDEQIAEWGRQRAALTEAPDARLDLLCRAESTGALIAEEMTAAGLPWDVGVHEAILEEALGPRPLPGARPVRMAELAAEIGVLLGEADPPLDSPPRLLRSLHRAGILVESTSRWELAEQPHAAIAPLLQYKKLARLHAANGWAWLRDWVRDGRFRPVYLAGGVVTGRWVSSGGGALQIPRALRPAVRADTGWRLVLADVAQLEPRVLAAMSQGREMATAARGADLYEGVVRSGAVATRSEAKYAVLGAMYGATTGESGRLVPRLRKVFPRAMALVDRAARTGEEGGVVSTLLGRSSPPPDAGWRAAQAGASDPSAGGAEERRARSRARDRGRFTRNFVVQGTAAEWSLLWLAEIRHRLWRLPATRTPAVASGPVFAERAHLAFFLHDEVIVHCPADQVEEVAQVVRDAADAATARLFPGFPIDIPLDLRIAEDAGKDP
ncbi:MAG: bifunctional 3'-5' exonuclease/DNA polymerase [Microbacterium sp.]